MLSLWESRNVWLPLEIGDSEGSLKVVWHDIYDLNVYVDISEKVLQNIIDPVLSFPQENRRVEAYPRENTRLEIRKNHWKCSASRGCQFRLAFSYDQAVLT